MYTRCFSSTLLGSSWQGNQTSTQCKCEWIIPSYLKNVEYLPVKSINFMSARKRKGNLDAAIVTVDEVQTSTSNTKVCEQQATYPSDTDLETFYNALSSAGTRPAILSLIPSHCLSYIPKRLLPTFPQAPSISSQFRIHDHGASWAAESLWVSWNYCYKRNSHCCWERNQKSV